MKRSALLYIVLAGVLWGSSGIFVNLLSPYGFTPVQMTCMRSVVSALCMGIYLLVRDKSCFKVTLPQLLLYALSGVSVFGTATFYYAAIGYSSVSVAAVLMYTAPVFVMICSVAFLGEKFNLRKALSVVLVIAGSVLVSGLVAGANFSLLGTVLGLCSALSACVYNVVTRVQMSKGCRPMSATFYIFSVMAVISLCVCDPVDLVQKTARNPAYLIMLIIGIGVFTCVTPYLLYTLALRDIPAGTASSLAIIEPMSATVFSVVLFSEKLTLASITGIVLILVSVFLLSKSEE
ncbi:MAG: DMT family transporter [Clostridia bacterium]|nr:DMT family transporter [Clostridia bacterium]